MATWMAFTSLRGTSCAPMKTQEVTLEVAAGRHEPAHERLEPTCLVLRFKFINGNTWDAVEMVPDACSELDSQNFNRYLSVATDGTAQEVNVCFAGCTPCDEIPKCATEQSRQRIRRRGKRFNCGAGFALKPTALELSGNSEATCCEEVLEVTGLVLRSAGWSDGNRAEFWLRLGVSGLIDSVRDGALLYATGTRGLTVVELLPNATVAGRGRLQATLR